MGMEGRWVGKYISRPRIFIDGTEKAFLPDQITGTAYPGMMEIKYTSSDIAIHQRLIFVSNRQSMILTEITNLTHKKLKVEPYLEGKFLESGRLTKETAKYILTSALHPDLHSVWIGTPPYGSWTINMSLFSMRNP